jgi:hypothetical protein
VGAPPFYVEVIMPIIRTPEQNKIKKERYYAKLAEDPDRSLTYFYRESRKGATRREISFQLTEDEFRNIWKKQKGKCALSGIDLTLEHGSISTPNPTRMSIDRIDSEYGYTASNVQLITWQLNSAKNVWSNQQLIEVCKLVAAKNL